MWRIHDVFYISLLEEDITRKEQANKMTSKLEYENDGDSEVYEIEVICNNAVYVKESDRGYHLPGLYYLVSWKSYLKEENT